MILFFLGMNNGRGEEAWVGSSRAPPLGVKKKIYNNPVQRWRVPAYFLVPGMKGCVDMGFGQF